MSWLNDALNSSEFEDSKQEIINEIKEIKSSRVVPELALHKIYETRVVDPYYWYLQQYQNGDFYKKISPLILGYQMLNRNINFYTNENDEKIYHGLAEDIISRFTDKILSTKYKINGEYDKNTLSPFVLEKIGKAVATSGTFLVLGTDLLVGLNQDYVGEEIVETATNEGINNISVYLPHEYDVDKKVLIYKDDKGKVQTKSFANYPHSFIAGESLIGFKRELIYLLSLIITSFGTETESGRMRIHADRRYDTSMSKDVFIQYDNIINFSENQETLFETTQGDIRASSWKEAVEMLVSLISKSLGIDIRGIVYTTATQTNMQSVDDVTKINNHLTKIARILEDIVRDILGKDVEITFDEYTQDTLDEKINRLVILYQNNGIRYEDYLRETYKLMNLEYSKEVVEQSKLEFGIASSTTEEFMKNYENSEDEGR